MRIQIIQDSKGNNSGIFIPMDDWALIKSNYPDVEQINEEIPDWQKKLLDSRLNAISQKPGLIKPIDTLFTELDNKD